MALASYSDLKTSIAAWLARSDLTATIDDFIDLAESRIYREIRCRHTETALSVVMSSGVGTIPADYVELRHAYLDGTPTSWLDIVTVQDLHATYPTRSASGRPVVIARDVGSFIFGPFPDSDYTVLGTYFAKLEGLSGTNTTNWLTDDAPELILFAALREASAFLRDDQGEAYYDQKYQRAKADIEAEYRAERFPSGMSLMASVR